MDEGGFDNDVEDRIEEQETNVDEENYEEMAQAQEQEAQYEAEARRQNTEILRSTIVSDAVNSYYDKLKEMGQGKPTIPDPNEFTLGVDGKLRLRKYPNVLLTKSNGEPYALSTLRGKHVTNAFR